VGRLAVVQAGDVDISNQGRRTRQNVIALAYLAIVLLGGAWLFSDLKQSAPSRAAC
jgi:hypothetical protein